MPAKSHIPSSPGQVVLGAGRFGGLDGLRAIAVGLVVVYHLFPRALPGGFLGVDVFFVISGFLITSLLLRERARTGRIDLLAFWRRRARRLLPAVALVVLVSTALALAASRDLLVGITQQIAGAVFFVSNWVFIENGTDYFGYESPEIFRNFWSLALEEQFYVAFPLLILLLLRMRARPSSAVMLLALGLISATLMSAMSASGVEATRIYFGSDSHSFGLLFGAGMAVLLERGRAVGAAATGAAVRVTPAIRTQLITLTVAVLSLGTIGVLAVTLPEASTASFQGGFQLASLAALALVWAVTREGALAGRWLDVAPLKWIGERSYGIYLWHWPLLLIVTQLLSGPLSRAGSEAAAGFAGWIAPVITLALTLLLAALSYTYVELPVRRLGLRGAFARWFSPRSYTPRRRRVAVTLAVVLAITFPLTGVAVSLAPERTSSADSIMRGKELLDANRRGTPAADSGGSDSATAPTTAATPDSATAASEPATTPAAVPQPITIDGRDITAVGDSVMLASYPELSAAFPGIDVDAAVSRGMGAGVEILSKMRDAGTLRSVIVVGLGTNGPVDTADLARLREIAGNRPIVLVDAHAERDWIPQVNADLTAFAAATRGVTLAQWDATIAQRPEFLAGDGIHPDSDGGAVYAQAVRAALNELGKPGEGIGFNLPRR